MIVSLAILAAASQASLKPIIVKEPSELTFDCGLNVSVPADVSLNPKVETSFELKFEVSGKPSNIVDSYYDVPISTLASTGKFAVSNPFQFRSGHAEFHVKYGLQGVYATIGGSEQKGTRLKILIPASTRGIFEIFDYDEELGVGDTKYIGACDLVKVKAWGASWDRAE